MSSHLSHDENAMEVNADGDSEFMRAVVTVSEETQKGTARSRQEYVNPLLVLSGRDYASISFSELHVRICDALRGKGLRVVAQLFTTGDEVIGIIAEQLLPSCTWDERLPGPRVLGFNVKPNTGTAIRLQNLFRNFCLVLYRGARRYLEGC